MPKSDGTGAQNLPVVPTGTDGNPANNGQPEPGKTPPVGGEGSTSPGWMAQLPNDLKNLDDLKQFATLGEYVHHVRNGGANGSGGEQTPSANEPVKYENFEKNLGDENDPFGTVGEALKGILESSGVAKEVAEQVFDTLGGAQASAAKELVEKGKDWCEANLKKAWGTEYEAKRRAMSRAYLALVEGDKELASALDRTGASINPAVAELLSRVGASIREDGSMPSNLSGGKPGRDPRVPVNYPD